jgi:23S rRNA pseudouridine955/2504/2580 synthase
MSRSTRVHAGAVIHVQIGAEQAGQRIDNFLARYLKGVPRSHVYRILRSGEVRVNKGRVKPGYRLAADDRIRIPPVRGCELPAGEAPLVIRTRLEAAVLLEDDDLIVLDKPSGIAVHGGSGMSYGIIEVLRQSRPDAPTLELVHRLDRDTSGCLLIAKSRRALAALHELLRTGKIDKHYIMLLAGTWQGGERTVTTALERQRELGTVVVSEGGKLATSAFKPLAQFAWSTLMEARLSTGRMHQIRVQAAHLGHPVAGDRKYGNSGFNRLMREYGLRRLFLHAARLGFCISESGRRYEVEAPLDAHLRRVLDDLHERHT